MLNNEKVAFRQKFLYSKGAHYETATLSSIELLPGERYYVHYKRTLSGYEEYDIWEYT